MENIDRAQTKWGFTECVRPEESEHNTLLSQILEMVRIDNLRFVPNNVHGQMYQLVRRLYDIFDFGR